MVGFARLPHWTSMKKALVYATMDAASAPTGRVFELVVGTALADRLHCSSETQPQHRSCAVAAHCRVRFENARVSMQDSEWDHGQHPRITSTVRTLRAAEESICVDWLSVLAEIWRAVFDTSKYIQLHSGYLSPLRNLRSRYGCRPGLDQTR